MNLSQGNNPEIQDAIEGVGTNHLECVREQVHLVWGTDNLDIPCGTDGVLYPAIERIFLSFMHLPQGENLKRVRRGGASVPGQIILTYLVVLTVFCTQLLSVSFSPLCIRLTVRISMCSQGGGLVYPVWGQIISTYLVVLTVFCTQLFSVSFSPLCMRLTVRISNVFGRAQTSRGIRPIFSEIQYFMSMYPIGS